MAPKDEDVYNDALKASGDEALAKAFLKAFKESSTLKTEPSLNEKQQLYGLFKQALQNPPFSEVKKPSVLQPWESGKWNAWKKVVDDGITPTEAQKKYIELVEELKAKYGTN
ncbi:hypothetical protein VTN96DRAFT_804 [Rasamsonia emersonii]|uniref:ACB domain-containing protein n=1 Tax=Rasamsonia emersonii (strain ATCC 16479 / CBS 393.64 / IMI 116815) TaxID=1408163 RepID=A0A0F4Z1S7_RASE3|nr:hypothetical protein T310_1501 [Rasamsonia emersonii CBS 393.64]KKA24472.1 hypothetical protein T310_1501 [Rasamsonia emersonii CBS 393.64]